jgi:predicted nucleic acid-binding protein
VTGVLLDTNVISEITRPHPDAQVVRFLEQLDNSWLSIITRHELRFGIALLPLNRRRDQLVEAVNGLLSTYADRVLPILEAEADEAAALRARARTSGRVMHLADALLAATATVHNLAIATRNVTDFADIAIKVIDPWESLE